MVTLQDFDKQINASILQRGKEYYNNGHVISIEETGDNRWIAEVDGSETYTVEVTLKHGYEINDYCCDCPFDGNTCKHVAAVLFALRNEVRKAKDQPKKTLKKEVFDNLLQILTTKEYQDFTRSYAARNKDFKTAFELFFADKDKRIDVQEKYTELVKKIIQKYTRQGYIDYPASLRLSKEMNILLKTGPEYVNKNNFSDAFALAKAILEPTMKVLAMGDDSSGSIGDCIENAIMLLETIATTDADAIDTKVQVFAFIQAALNNKDYFDYGDFGYYLCDIFKGLAIQLNKVNIFLEFLDSWIPKLTGQYDSYLNEYFQRERIAVLQQSGKAAEAEKLVQKTMDIVEVRKSVVDKAIQRNDLVTAKEIIAEGIKIAESKEHPGTVIQWQKELLRIAMLEKDTETIRQYTKYFAFDGGFSDEYYKQWKATFAPAKWQKEIEEYITETIDKITKGWGRSKNKYWQTAHPPLLQSLAPIYIREFFLDRLLALVQQVNGLTTILEYHPYLVKKYPNELLVLYAPALEMHGMKCSSRDDYADLVHKMKKIIKDIPEGKEKILDVAKRLKGKFSSKPRRPAMIEELNKIL